MTHLHHKVGNLKKVISELNAKPARPLSTLRRPPYEKPAHDSGPQLIANLYRTGTFTLYSLPAFTGAFDLTPLRILMNENSDANWD